MVSVKEFEKEVQENSVVVVDFWAEWCPHCMALMPQLDAVKEEVGEKARIIKANADESPELSAKLGVTALPTFLIYKNGELLDKFNGSTTAVELKQKIKSAVE